MDLTWDVQVIPLLRTAEICIWTAKQYVISTESIGWKNTSNPSESGTLWEFWTSVRRVHVKIPAGWQGLWEHPKSLPLETLAFYQPNLSAQQISGVFSALIIRLLYLGETEKTIQPLFLMVTFHKRSSIIHLQQNQLYSSIFRFQSFHSCLLYCVNGA